MKNDLGILEYCSNSNKPFEMLIQKWLLHRGAFSREGGYFFEKTRSLEATLLDTQIIFYAQQDF